jgi:hypothetical protein
VHGFDDDAVVFAAEGFEPADKVAGVGDGGAEAFADRFVAGAAAEVVVPACAHGLERDLDLAAVALELHDGVAARIEAGELEWAAIGAAGVQALEGRLRLREVLFVVRG